MLIHLFLLILKEECAKMLNYINGSDNMENFTEEEILLLNDPEISTWYASNVKGANKEAHKNIVLKSKNVEWCYKFARDVKGIDISELAKVVIDSKDPYFNYVFARDVIGANVILHEQVLLEYNNPDYCLEFALNVIGATIELHEDVIINDLMNYINVNTKEADKSIERCLNFAKSVKGANREKLKDAASKLPRYNEFKLEFDKLYIIPNLDNNSDVVIPDRILDKILRLRKQV